MNKKLVTPAVSLEKQIYTGVVKGVQYSVEARSAEEAQALIEQVVLSREEPQVEQGKTVVEAETPTETETA